MDFLFSVFWYKLRANLSERERERGAPWLPGVETQLEGLALSDHQLHQVCTVTVSLSQVQVCPGLEEVVAPHSTQRSAGGWRGGGGSHQARHNSPVSSVSYSQTSLPDLQIRPENRIKTLLC